MSNLFQSSCTILRAIFLKNFLKSDLFQVKTLQWIPNLVRIKSKLLNLVYKVLCDLIPAYFSNFISCHLSPHSLLQPLWLVKLVLSEPKKAKESFRLGVFIYADPHAWNIFLPYSQFQSILQSSILFSLYITSLERPFLPIQSNIAFSCYPFL